MRTINHITTVDPSNIRNEVKPTALACNDNTMQNETESAEVRIQKVYKHIDPNNILHHKRNQQTSYPPWK
jgi:hypothetical protein